MQRKEKVSPNIFDECGKSAGKEFIEEVGKAEEISLVPLPEGVYMREIKSKPPMAVRSEGDKLELTIKSLNILCYVDDERLQRWTMKPADKCGGMGRRGWQRSGYLTKYLY